MAQAKKGRAPKGPTKEERVQPEFSAEIGKDDSWFANIKGQFDLHQNLIAHALSDLQLGLSRSTAQTAEELANINAVKLAALSAAQVTTAQALANATESSNMVAKQSIDHRDLAHDRMWNVDEQGFTVEKILNNTTFQDAIKAAVVAVVAATTE